MLQQYCFSPVEFGLFLALPGRIQFTGIRKKNDEEKKRKGIEEATIRFTIAFARNFDGRDGRDILAGRKSSIDRLCSIRAEFNFLVQLRYPYETLYIYIYIALYIYIYNSRIDVT